jgi:hypothetical protein
MQRSSFALLEFDPELNKLIKGKQLRDGLSAVANRRVALDRQRGTSFGFRPPSPGSKRVSLSILQPPPPHVSFVYPCRFGAVTSITANGHPVPVTGKDVKLPAGTTQATIKYL